ncbi:MAG: OmpH family outer membrane protein [Gammaproteobacteria bacterium]|nr:OmpH family outer membrane protein [Gammaproteobacteria bacterium]
MKSVRLVAIALLALVVAGCDQLDAGRSGVAVIDLDAVARALGRDDVIAQQINQANQQLTSQLGQVAKDLQQQLEEERDKYEVVGDEAQAELEQKTAVANQRLQQTQRLAQQRSAEFRTAVINAFRNEVQPYASEIARERGAVAVVTVATPMLWFDAEVDITDEVIAAMRKAGLERTGEASPAADAAPQEDAAAAEDAATGTAGADAAEEGTSG